MHVPRYGVLAAAHYGCGLGVAQVFAVDKQNRITLLVGQRAHRRPEIYAYSLRVGPHLGNAIDQPYDL